MYKYISPVEYVVGCMPLVSDHLTQGLQGRLPELGQGVHSSQVCMDDLEILRKKTKVNKQSRFKAGWSVLEQYTKNTSAHAHRPPSKVQAKSITVKCYKRWSEVSFDLKHTQPKIASFTSVHVLQSTQPIGQENIKSYRVQNCFVAGEVMENVR